MQNDSTPGWLATKRPNSLPPVEIQSATGIEKPRFLLNGSDSGALSNNHFGIHTGIMYQKKHNHYQNFLHLVMEVMKFLVVIHFDIKNFLKQQQILQRHKKKLKHI